MPSLREAHRTRLYVNREILKYCLLNIIRGVIAYGIAYRPIVARRVSEENRRQNSSRA